MAGVNMLFAQRASVNGRRPDLEAAIRDDISLSARQLIAPTRISDAPNDLRLKRQPQHLLKRTRRRPDRSLALTAVKVTKLVRGASIAEQELVSDNPQTREAVEIDQLIKAAALTLPKLHETRITEDADPPHC
jgi:hypothetical protein